jgi:xyloglucan-specific exo-beta-1,4-glucanase
MKKLFIFLLIAIIGLVRTHLMAQVTPATDTYQWGRFETGGGGYFTGIAFSPNTPGLMYVRSDVTFMHRMNPGQTRWTSTGDRFWPEKVAGKSGSRYPFGGSIGIAIHPVNPQIVFTTYGYADNNFDGTRGVYRTADGGQTWEQVLSVNANGNSSAEQVNQRKCGNPIAIDPSDPNVVYVGTQSNGLYRSTTGGGLNSWTKINSVPNSPGSLAGTKCVVVDRFSTLTAGRRSVVYASVYNDGVYRSSDGSNTFIKLTGSPKSPQWMVQGPTGTLYVTNRYFEH